MSKSLWETIQGRDTLEAFPCVAELSIPGLMCCYGESGEGDSCSDPACPLRPIYEEYLALRAVVEADLAGTTPRQAEIVCAVSIGLETDKTVLATLRRKRKAWEDLT